MGFMPTDASPAHIHGALLRNAHLDEAVGKLFLKGHRPGGQHGVGRHDDQPFILAGGLQDGLHGHLPGAQRIHSSASNSLRAISTSSWVGVRLCQALLFSM